MLSTTTSHPARLRYSRFTLQLALPAGLASYSHPRHCLGLLVDPILALLLLLLLRSVRTLVRSALYCVPTYLALAPPHCELAFQGRKLKRLLRVTTIRALRPQPIHPTIKYATLHLQNPPTSNLPVSTRLLGLLQE